MKDKFQVGQIFRIEQRGSWAHVFCPKRPALQASCKPAAGLLPSHCKPSPNERLFIQRQRGQRGPHDRCEQSQERDPTQALEAVLRAEVCLAALWLNAHGLSPGATIQPTIAILSRPLSQFSFAPLHSYPGVIFAAERGV
jgi:hypothetical protein